MAIWGSIDTGKLLVTAFGLWAAVVLWVGERVIDTVEMNRAQVADLAERVTRVEAKVAPGIPPPPVEKDLEHLRRDSDELERRIRALEQRR